MRITNIILLFCLGTILLASCRKDEEFYDGPSANLLFSTDSVTFDTVFTTVGTVTKNIRVYNPYDERVKINSIRLNGGQLSTFRINVDGSPGPFHSGLEIAAKDSMYIFIEATVDPTNATNPFVISDFIEFNTNGNRQLIDLVAWGQNAIYFTPTSFNRNLPDFTCLTGPCSDSIPPVNVTWTDELPYVIYGYVAVDSLDQLTIEAGAKIYFHQDGGLWVYRGGTIKVNGTKDKPVIFQGDRREEAYKNRPGQWDRIWINEGGANEIHHAIIRNSFIGIQAEVLPFDDPPYNDPAGLFITDTKIENCSGYGLLSSIYNVQAENLVISNCGQYNVVIQGAGNYDFTHCTFANYFDQAARETPAFFVRNSFINSNATQIIGEPEVAVYNSIIHGNLQNEFATEVINNGEIDLDFRSVLLKSTQSVADTSQFKNIILNPANQIFANPLELDFSLSKNSVARDKGNLSIANLVPFDIKENDRTQDGQPDLGAYEYIP